MLHVCLSIVGAYSSLRNTFVQIFNDPGSAIGNPDYQKIKDLLVLRVFGDTAGKIENPRLMCYTQAKDRLEKLGNEPSGDKEQEELRSLSPAFVWMNIFLIKVAIVLIVGTIVGGSTYVMLTIIEILQKK
jgi:hypothetical protein